MGFNIEDFNYKQREAIRTTDGPLLIIAGPGTGKTKTLIGRALYLVQEKQIKPENIFMTTFTDKAAKEMQTRMVDAFREAGVAININEMFIGTFHSLCLRILTENIEYSGLNKNIRIIDDFDQKYLVKNHIRDFRCLPDFFRAFWISDYYGEDYANDILTNNIIKWVNKLTDAMVNPEDMKNYIGDNANKVHGLANAYELYLKLLAEQNALDFGSIQVKTYQLLKDHPEILARLQEQFTYFMIDEFQDTNGIQEKLVLLLGGKNNNICAVGDDDQGLYRFRGATVKNILTFPDKFPGIAVKKIIFDINYRSYKGIVDFYSNYMTDTLGMFEWEDYRYPKQLQANRQSERKSPEVIKITGQSKEAWYERIYTFLKGLMDSGKITDYNQVAFLFSSVRGRSDAEPIAAYLEQRGIKVYSPRSSLFFKRQEIQDMVGCLLYILSGYIGIISRGDSPETPNNADNYILWYNELKGKLELPEYRELKDTLDEIKQEIHVMGESMDYAYTGIVYRILGCEPFRSILSTAIDSGVYGQRAVRNLAIFTQQIARFEYTHSISVFKRKYMSYTIKIFFNRFLNYLINQGVSEYEDDSEYAPGGCVSFMTIHQSKGLEFPIVVVFSLEDSPYLPKFVDYLDETMKAHYLYDSVYELEKKIPFYDFWRKFYTAFSRAQDLLVLAAPDSPEKQSVCFSGLLDKLVEFDDKAIFSLEEFEFQTIKPIEFKKSLSFTSHINVYDKCPLQYKFFKELGFVARKVGPMLYGTLVHETIEDMHKAVLRGEQEIVTPDNIDRWFHANYATLIKREHMYLHQNALQAALKQVQLYAERRKGYWDDVREAEVGVTLVKDDYIIDGKIDLVKGEGENLEILDFKSEKKPDFIRDKDRIEKYRRQLQIYAYLVSKNTDKTITRLNLYYTGTEKGEDPILSFDYNEEDIATTMEMFDRTARKILNRDFSGGASSKDLCNNCDFKYYCRK